MTSSAALDVVIICGAAAAALLAVIKLTVKIVHAVRRVASWAKRMDDRLEYLDGEMRHDHGASVRDAIARTDRNVFRLAEAMPVDVELEQAPPRSPQEEQAP